MKKNGQKLGYLNERVDKDFRDGNNSQHELL